MWRFETLIKGMRARKDRPEVAVRMEAGLVDMGRRGGGVVEAFSRLEKILVCMNKTRNEFVWDHHVCVTNAMSINPTPCQE